MNRHMEFTVNGHLRSVTTDDARSLLEVVREELGLTGAKYGCGEGRCGACTVLIDGEAAHACITPVAKVVGKEILTVEGLAKGKRLHPVQRAFIEENAFQCGYCTPGMIMAVVGLLGKNAAPTDDEVLACLDGHICRCGSHPNILAAVRRAVELNGSLTP